MPHLTMPHLRMPHLRMPHLTMPHPLKLRLSKLRPPSRQLATPHLATPHLTTPHLTTPHLTTPHLATPHLTKAGPDPVPEPAVPEGGRRAEPGPDGRLRCPWALGSPDYLGYHDDEWGRPVRDDQGIYERLSLEAFQSGLSWLTILRKRENFRAAFHGFDIAAVAAFGPEDEARLLGDAGIVRNRAKIEAAIGNARAAQALPGGLAAFVWHFGQAPDGTGHEAPLSTAQIPSWTPASKNLSRELRRHGFSFTGPVTAYATLQACGVVDDHLLGCFRRGAYS
jgi:DNA-3-methyladenine glycosylase I